MGFMKTVATSATFVDSNYKLQYYGTILDLESFAGHIFLYGNTFINNVLQYSSCDVAWNNMITPTNTLTDQYPNYGTKNRL